jgi:protein MpaA
VAIWFHQPLALVDQSGGNVAVERRFARLAGLPLRRLPRYPGSAVGWQDHSLRGTTAFVVELPPGELAQARASRYAGAILALANPRGRTAGEPYD